jgi:hypothetical protein
MNIFRKNSRVLVWCRMNRSHATQIRVDGVDQVSPPPQGMTSSSSDHVRPQRTIGTRLRGIRFRRALLDTIADIGEEIYFR